MTRVRLLTVVAVVVGIATSAGVIHAYRTPRPATVFAQRSITRGDVVETVVAIGTVQPTRTVEIGAQVSGTVATLNADFNSIVRRGDVIAEIDPSLIRDALASAESSRDLAAIALNQALSTLQTDRQELTRQFALFSNGLATEQERDAARVAVDEDELAAAEARATVAAAEAGVSGARVDLEHCIIRSPVDGVVLSRNVEVGQTLESRTTPPTLFVLATNLHQLEVLGNVDESDVARIRPGQDVTFTVEAYPMSFHGRVSAVRLNATNVSNVVTYQTVIAVANPELRLLPGMTATFTVETRHAVDVERVPTAALRFRPPSTLAGSAVAVRPVASDVTLTASSAERSPAAKVNLAGASSIDEVLGVQPARDVTGTVWVTDAHGIRPVALRVGTTDGTWTEVRSGPLGVGDEVITGVGLVPTAVQARR